MSEATTGTEHALENYRQPDRATDPAAAFFASFNEIVGFVGFVVDLASKADFARVRASEALLPLEEDPEKKKHLEETLSEKDRVVRTLRERYGHLLLETTLARAVDNYLTFVAELMSVVFRTRSETLHSVGTVKVAFILQHDSMDELIEGLAERQVEALAYAGVADLQATLADTLGFDLFDTTADRDTAVRIIEARNLIVHNRGVINRRYQARVADAPALGSTLPLTVDDVFDHMVFLAESARDIDHRAARKWDLEQKPFPAESDEDQNSAEEPT